MKASRTPPIAAVIEKLFQVIGTRRPVLPLLPGGIEGSRGFVLQYLRHVLALTFPVWQLIS